MATLNHVLIVKSLERAVAGQQKNFIFEFLKAYGSAASTVKLLQLGDKQRNLASIDGDIALQDKVYFRCVSDENKIDSSVKEIKSLPIIASGNIRFLLVTDYHDVVGVDLKVDDQIRFSYEDFKTYYEFFLPLTGLYEKPVVYAEHPADTKACEKMGRLYDGIRSINKFETKEEIHALNLFLTRLLFCFFAEDTGIFPVPDMMTDAITATTRKDGSDVQLFFAHLFDVLDLPMNAPDRRVKPLSFQKFPYVNGGLFKERVRIPKFNATTRNLLLDCGQMSWREISPSIFGSMFQVVMNPEERRSLGAHYTSEKNILKVIRPLFLDDLTEELEKILQIKSVKIKQQALADYHAKLGRLKFLDPACGSGNFLIVSYREIRRLENKCLKAMQDLNKATQVRQLNVALLVKVHIDQFYGIEILDFPVDIAKVSMYLMEHVMNLEMEKEFGTVYPTIPLKYTPGIVCANALTTPWENVVKTEQLDFIFGNPPFGGARLMSAGQKKDLFEVFHGVRGAGDLDYVAAWYRLAANAMLCNPHIETAFVSTNSVCQGTQVAPLWTPLLGERFHINFAYQTFPWTSEAQGKATVHCVIVGFSLKDRDKKWLFSNIDGAKSEGRTACASISPYLVKDASGIVRAENSPLSAQTQIFFGNMALDGGALLLEDSEKEDLRRCEPEVSPWIRKALGSKELLHSIPRWCLWLKDAPQEVLHLPMVRERLERCRKVRQESKRVQTRNGAAWPHLFQEIREWDPTKMILVVPRVSSERRPYIPMAYVDGKTIVTDSAFMVPGASLFEFGVAISAMHMAWMRTVCGRLEMRYRYSRDLCWNTFPWPSPSAEQKIIIEKLADAVLATRDGHPDMCLADMYNPESMPEDLRVAHEALDLAVDNFYRPTKPFKSDEERLQLLFTMYEKLVKEKGGK